MSSFLSHRPDATLTGWNTPVTGARPFYDLTNPIVYHRDEATVAEGGELESSGTVKVMAKKRNRKTSEVDFARVDM